MRKDKLYISMNEAAEFINRCQALKRVLLTSNFKYERIDGCKESGAVRRASMDLTRALAELRKWA
jgi:hypothetical protein